MPGIWRHTKLCGEFPPGSKPLTPEEFDAHNASKKSSKKGGKKALSQSKPRSGTHSGRGDGTGSAVAGGQAESPSPDSDSSSEGSEESVSVTSHNRLHSCYSDSCAVLTLIVLCLAEEVQAHLKEGLSRCRTSAESTPQRVGEVEQGEGSATGADRKTEEGNCRPQAWEGQASSHSSTGRRGCKSRSSKEAAAKSSTVRISSIAT
jgi:hypothetical protein